MTLFCCPDKLVIFNPDQLPQLQILCVHTIGKLQRGRILLLGFAFNLLPVLVSSTKELYIKTHHALVSRNSVGNDRGVGATQMGRRVHVIERCRDVKSVRHRNKYSGIGNS